MIREHVVTAANGRLVGISCRPSVDTNAPTVLFINAGIVHRIGPNRLYVRLARALARLGVPSVRFDLSGLGDSGAPAGALDPTASALSDIDAAIQEFIPAGPVILAGLCSGAAAAIRGGHDFERVSGVVALDPINWPTPKSRLLLRWRHWSNGTKWRSAFRDLRRFRGAVSRMLNWSGNPAPELDADADARRLLDPTHPDQAEMERSLKKLAARGGRALFVYCGREQTVYDSQLFDAVPELRKLADSLSLVHLVEASHSFDSVASQEQLEQQVTAWISLLPTSESS